MRQPCGLAGPPFAPISVDVRLRCRDGRIALAVMHQETALDQNAEAFLQPAIVRAAQLKPGLDRCDVCLPARRKARHDQLRPQQPTGCFVDLLQIRATFKQVISRRLHPTDL